ncbi:MAG: imidazolonepropionase [Bradymonadales bacterium]
MLNDMTNTDYTSYNHVVLADTLLCMTGWEEKMAYDEAKKTNQLKTRDEQILGIKRNCALLIEDGYITYIGEATQLPQRAKSLKSIHVKTLMPSWIECHTHAIFAGQRAGEFLLKNAGLSYGEIAKAGGGIRSSVESTRNASDSELQDLLVQRLSNFVRQGIGCIEVKSGYGLSTREELRMLEIIQSASASLQERHASPTEVVATFLGAHSLSPEFLSMSEYCEHIVDEMLPKVAAQGIAKCCDVFCEQGAFSLEQATKIWERAKSLGMDIRAHAEQFSRSGATLRCAELGGLTADHLDELRSEDIAKLRDSHSKLVCVVFPLVAVYMDTPKRPPVRAIIDAGLNFAISTNFNPGTCPASDLGLAASLACTLFGCTPAEALFGVTRGAALALAKHDDGKIHVGAKANLLGLNDEYANILYYFGKKEITYFALKGVLLRS